MNHKNHMREAVDNLSDWVHKAFFSRNGDYDELTKLDVSSVRQASIRAILEIEKWIKQFGIQHRLKYLDLACGTNVPFVSNGIFSFLQEYYPNIEISYEGIDINKDITKAGKFLFPENVVSQNLLWGNAFELKNSKVAISKNTYDIIYFGLILHHATAQEIVSLGLFLSSILKQNGVIFIHDLFRPHNKPHVKRPPDRPRMITDQSLLKNIPDEPLELAVHSSSYSDWREEFRDTFTNHLKDINAPEYLRTSLTEHIISDDFPYSIFEVQAIFDALGFETNVFPFSNEDTASPLKGYIGFITARKINSKPRNHIQYPIKGYAKL